MTHQTFAIRNFRVLYGPITGTPADASGRGVASPEALRPETHLVIPFAAPDRYAVPIGLGMLYSQGHPPDDHAVRVDIQLPDGRWTEYDPSTAHSRHSGPSIIPEKPAGRPRRPRRAPVAPSMDAGSPYPDHPAADQRF